MSDTTFIVLGILYWFVSAAGLLWADARFGWDLTAGEPLLAGMYVLMAPALAVFAVLAGAFWLIGAAMLKVARLLPGRL